MAEDMEEEMVEEWLEEEIEEGLEEAGGGEDIRRNDVPNGQMRRQRNHVQNGQEGNQEPNGRRRQRKNGWRREWEDRPEYRFVRPDPNNAERCVCLACGNKDFAANLDTILAHCAGVRHRRNVEENFGPPDHDEEAQRAEQRRIAKRETARIQIMLIAFFARYRLPFVLIDVLFDFLINICPNFEALKAAKIKRTTFTNMTKAIASIHKQNLALELANNKFSILFDEATDTSTNKHGCVVVRYFDRRTSKVVETLWAVIGIFDNRNRQSVASAKELYKRIINSFGNFRFIPRSNVLSFCSDGCATMVGVANSVSRRFIRFFLNIICIVCPAHAAHLVAGGAFTIFPQWIRELPNKVYNFFKSPKRLHMLKQQQEVLRLKKHRPKRAVPTRWLVMGPSVDRLLEQWQPLINVINTVVAVRARIAINANNEEQANQENERRANLITLRDAMANPVAKCYMAFLNDILPELEDFNRMTQSTSTMLPHMYEAIDNLLRSMILRFVDEEFLLGHDYVNTQYHELNVNIFTMDIGELAERLEQELLNDEEEVFAFRNICFNYCVSLIEQIKDRLEAPWRRFQNVNCFLPARATSIQYHRDHVGVMTEMLALFSRAADDQPGFALDEITLTREWENLVSPDFEEDVNRCLNSHTTIESFWLSLMNVRNPLTGGFVFRNLAQFAINVCCIPHANAQTEREWSEEKITKTPIRNLLGLESENALMLITSMLKLRGCYDEPWNFVPDEEMIQCILQKTYTQPRRVGEVNELLQAVLPAERIEQEPVAVQGEDEDLSDVEDEPVQEEEMEVEQEVEMPLESDDDGNWTDELGEEDDEEDE